MSWYNNSGPHPPQNPQNQMPHSHNFPSSQQLPPQPATTYTNHSHQQQWPHQQPAAAPPVNLQQPPPPTAWNTSHGPTFFKPADMNQNFASQQQPPAMAAPQPNNNNNNNGDGWGDWGEEWAQDGVAGPATAAGNPNPVQVDHYQQQLPPPPPQQQMQQPQFYSNQQNQPTMFTPANYPAPPPVTFDANLNAAPAIQEQQQSNVIADSFSTTAVADNWNWNAVDSNANQVELIRKPVVFNTMSTGAIEKIQSAGTSTTTPEVVPQQHSHQPPPPPSVYNTNQPDDMKSQGYGANPQFNQQTFGGDDLDPLDMALMQINDPQTINTADNGASFFGPPSSGDISLPNSTANVAVAPVEAASSKSAAPVGELVESVTNHAVSGQQPAPVIATTPTPPPPAAASTAEGMVPPPTSVGPPPPTTVGLPGNPFKRCGTKVPRNTFFEPPATPSQTFVPQPPSAINHQGTFAVAQPPLAPQPHNSSDRNEYLQTDQLSEDVQQQQVSENAAETVQSETYDHLPPPGLSRLVLGETEDQHYNVPMPSLQPPSLPADLPRGMNRMVPGTDLEGSAADVALQRAADGQDDDPAGGSVYPPALSDLSDRNLYQVPGEEHLQQQQVQQQQQNPQNPPPSRVVTGDENAVPFMAVVGPPLPVVSMGGISAVTVPAQVEESRDQQPVDGENACDDDNLRFNRQHGETLSRDEPIEGENAGDDIVISSGGAAAVSTEVADITSNGGDGHSAPSTAAPVNNIPRKETSTGEDSEERDRASYYKAKSSRRHEETGSLRRKPKHHERYESESDHSEKRDQRKNYDRSYVSERQRGDERDGRRRRGGVEESSRHNRSERERRYGDRRDDDYDGGYGGRGGEERRSKRYTEDDRDDRRRTDGDAKRADKERQYRKDRDRERERGDDRRDGRYRERDRRYEYEDERYNRSGSRNTERSRDPRYAGGYYGQNYGYGHYPAYTPQQQQQMEYYENLRRTNPKAYEEWYRKFYMQAAAGGAMHSGAFASGIPAVAASAMMGQPEMPTDGRESVHSGRSSTNDKDRYNRMSMSTGYFPQQQPQYGGSVMDNSLMDSSYGGPTSLMSSYSYAQPHHPPRSQVYTPSGHHLQQPSFYSQSDLTDSRLAQQQQQQEHRMTPLKFTNEHGQVSLNNGLMVCVKPKYSQNGVVNLVKIINIGSLAGEFDSDRRLLAVYPGPLVRGVTHKKTVIEFCEERLKMGPFSVVNQTRENSLLRSHANSMTSLCSATQHSSQQPGHQFKASYNLLWNLLILLLRQNGTVVGTDIAELLIKNVSEFPTTSANLVIVGTVKEEDSKAEKTVPDRAVDGGDVSLSDINSDESNEDNQPQSSGTKASQLSEDQITDKFRNHLLYGNVTEALDWATENNLWGHALFLASKMDRRSHSNVMMKFANKLALNDPLQTLYQLMSLRMPSFVTSVVDKKWGDWRPHLAMILSNTSQKPELDRKAITTLGDSLFHNGDIYGSHFCYLMAQVGFGKYETWSPETVASAPATKLVLLGSSPLRSFKEFATTEAIMMTEIYEYAVTLNDESYMIGAFQPYKFTLGTRFLDYGHQLKAFLYMEQLANNIKRDPQNFEWQLMNNVYVFADRLRYYDPVQEKSVDNSDSQDSDGDHQRWIQELKELQSQWQVNPNTQHQQQLPSQDQHRGSIDKQFAEINQQFNQLNLQYQNYEQQPPPSDYYSQEQSQAPPEQQQYIQSDYSSQKEAVADSTESQPQAEVNHYDPYGYQQPPQEQFQQQPPMGNFYNPTAYGEDNGGFNSHPSGDQPAQNTGYDYYGQQQQQQQQVPENDYEQPRPQISMPSSMSNRPGFYEDDADSAKKPSNQQHQQAGLDKSGKGDKDKTQIGGKANEQSSGWFGGIWGKLSMKPKNQMILPDDKNPSIVWDPDKKRWINTDEGEAEGEAFKPPPKMSELNLPQQPQMAPIPTMPQQQPPMQQQVMPGMPPAAQSPPFMSAGAPVPTHMMNAGQQPQLAEDPSTVDGANRQATNNLQSNQFKLQRNRTLKKSYVDVFNPSGATMKTAENIMAPSTVPTVPQGGFFIPGAAPMGQPQ